MNTAVAGEVIELYTGPSGDGYSNLKQARRGEKLEPTALPRLTLGVDAMLG